MRATVASCKRPRCVDMSSSEEDRHMTSECAMRRTSAESSDVKMNLFTDSVTPNWRWTLVDLVVCVLLTLLTVNTTFAQHCLSASHYDVGPDLSCRQHPV